MPTFENKPINQVNKKTTIMRRGDMEIPLTIVAMSTDFMLRYRDKLGVLARPKVSQTYVREDGKLVRDELGQPITKDGPEGAALWREWNEKYTALALVDVLRESPGLAWDTKAPESEDTQEWNAYATALHKEIVVDGGFTQKEIDTILKMADDLECQIDVDKALDSF